MIAKKTRTKSDPFLRIGVDTGGTFTDFIAVFKDRRLAYKVPSTPGAPERAILIGLTRAFDEFLAASDASTVSIEIVHGTTVATNALLERKGARVALVTTAGFEDVIEIGRQARPDLYNLSVTRPAPLAPRDLRFGVKERIAADGSVIEPVKQVEIDALVKRLKRAKVESIAVSLLFSFANPAHEQAIADALQSLGVPISISSQILPEYREYERTSTVLVNAYLAPLVSRYLNELTGALSQQLAGQKKHRLRIMQSSGGSISAEVAAREPVRTILSGPAGGVVAATRVAETASVSDIITFDMGGTSTDVALCRGEARTTSEAQIAGLPVAAPVLDIHTVGAGGGSIAYVDAGGALRVGPESAGADPGPACYGAGTRPTVTDANLVLGRVDPAAFAGGRMTLDRDAAEQAVATLASEVEMNTVELAEGICDVINAKMAQAIRTLTVEKGIEPRDFALVAFGGAGPMHAVFLARELGIREVIVPPYPGAFSAWGMLETEIRKDFSRTAYTPLAALDHAAFARTLEELETEGFASLEDEGITRETGRVLHAVDVRYVGQEYTLTIPLTSAGEPLDPDFDRAVSDRFHAAHQLRFGHANPGASVEFVIVRAMALGDLGRVDPAAGEAADGGYSSQTAEVTFGRRRLPTAMIRREDLPIGAGVDGPAIVSEPTATTVVPPGASLRVEPFGSLVVTAGEER